MAVRRALWHRGLRYRVNREDLSGCPNLAFIRYLRGTGVAAYLSTFEANLAHAQRMGWRTDRKTKRLYDRRTDQLSMDESKG